MKRWQRWQFLHYVRLPVPLEESDAFITDFSPLMQQLQC